MQISSAVDTEGAGLKKLICITVIVPLIKGIAEEVEVTKLVAVLLIITVYVLAEQDPSDS